MSGLLRAAAVVGLVLACAGAALLGTWLGAPSSSPPDGTVLLPPGVPYRTEQLVRGSTATEAEVPAEAAPVFRPDGLVVAIGADQRSLMYRDPARGTIVWSIGLPGPVAEMAPVLDDHHVYLTDTNGAVRLVDLDTREVGGDLRLEGHPGPIAVSPDLRLAYIGDTAGGSITVIDTGSLQMLGTWPVAGPVSDLAVGADGHRLVVAEQAKAKVQVLDTANGRPVSTASLPAAPFYYAAGDTAVAAGPTSAFVADATGVTVVDLVTGAASRPSWTRDAVVNLALSPDGRRLYLDVDEHDEEDGTHRTAIVVVDPVEDRVIGRTELNAAGTPALAPDGHRLFLIGGDPGSQILDLR